MLGHDLHCCEADLTGAMRVKKRQTHRRAYRKAGLMCAVCSDWPGATQKWHVCYTSEWRRRVHCHVAAESLCLLHLRALLRLSSHSRRAHSDDQRLQAGARSVLFPLVPCRAQSFMNTGSSAWELTPHTLPSAPSHYSSHSH